MKGKSVLIIIVSVVAVAIIGVLVYMIFSMNNTITALNEKIDDQQVQSSTLDSQPTPQPTDGHNSEISDIENLYSQKEELIQNYYDKADDLKETFKDDKDFATQYALASRSYNVAIQIYNQIKDDGLDKHSTSIISAVLCAVYDTYADQETQHLLKAKGIIDGIKSSFDLGQYNIAKKILDAITEINI